MCGIAGFERDRNDREIARRLISALARRGPDGNWFSQVDGYGFVQTRLAVIDLSERVRYPLQNESGDLHMLFNGEIYGYQELRHELERHGHKFTTACDAEVVVHGYEEWGTDVFGRLDGMFAVALYHQPSRELLLVRDALGIKPLAHTTRGRFAFASDALSLVSAGLADGALDPDVVDEFLAFHYLLPPGTGFRDVTQVAPGELARRAADGHLVKERWRRKPFALPPPASPLALSEAAASLDRSVRRQLVADVPVGVFLSSGIDSSLILDSAVRAGARPTAFTVAFGGHGDFDEAPTAARFAKELGVPHEISQISGGFADTLDRVVSAFDQPLGDASSIAMVELARLARSRVKVALSGTGGDDLFGGYYRHRVHRLAPLLGRIPAPLARVLRAQTHGSGHERRSGFALISSYLGRLASLRTDDALSQYLELVGSANAAAVAARLGQGDRPDAPVEMLQRLRDFSDAAGSDLRAIQALELETYLPGDLLLKEDRATMSVGLEGRVPLLGADVLAVSERATDRQKITLRKGKLLLRAIAEKRLPEYLARARKRGFAVPLGDLFASGWRSEAADWFAGRQSSLLDCDRASSMLRTTTLPPTEAWALAVLVQWEEAARYARSAGTGSAALPQGLR